MKVPLALLPGEQFKYLCLAESFLYLLHQMCPEVHTADDDIVQIQYYLVTC